MAHLEWKTDFGLVQWLRFDAVRSVELSQKANVTRHPVQSGANIADHVNVDLPHVSITGFISIAPLSIMSTVVGAKDIPAPSGHYEVLQLPGPPVSPTASFGASAIQGGFIQAAMDALASSVGPNSVESLITDDPGNRASVAAQNLLALQSATTMIRFVDELNVYEDMVITSVVGTRTQQFYGAAFQVELDQIRIVESKLVDAPIPAEPRGQIAKATASTPKSSDSTPVDEAKKGFVLGLAQKLFNFP